VTGSLPLEEQVVRIREFRELIDNAAKKYGFQDSIINVSDTIFVIAKNNKEGLKKLLKFSGDLLENGIKNYLPIRAAIDFGEAQIDKERNLIMGKAAAKAYELTEMQDWIGTCCAEDLIEPDDMKEDVGNPRLPYISELWDFDLVFVYPVPMKNGKVLFRPVVSWNVPSYNDFRTGTVDKGLVSEKNMDWKYATRVQNTIIFSQYLKAIKCGLLSAKSNVFRGDLPIKHIYDIINSSFVEIHFLNNGFGVVKIPGMETTIIPLSNKEKFISALENILMIDRREKE
jgi:hypothetical protein